MAHCLAQIQSRVAAVKNTFPLNKLAHILSSESVNESYEVMISYYVPVSTVVNNTLLLIFEVLQAVVTKTQVFWDMTLFLQHLNPEHVSRRFLRNNINYLQVYWVASLPRRIFENIHM
jgi:hypothetical protein